jgi:orotidine-5'-phosphate decarboxylase
MEKQQLFSSIRQKSSFLCIGLDTDIRKIPGHLHRDKDPVFEFNRQIIDATADLCVAYKPNVAFYESMGATGWETLHKTAEYIPGDILKIADAKRGDIGNTSDMYARTFFDQMAFDAVTVAPYMGSDSVLPFLRYEGKWVILLALTSNQGAQDFQNKMIADSGRPLYEEVMATSATWAGDDRMMYVVGATRADHLEHIRTIVPEHFLLVPGIGVQGGDLQAVARKGFNKDCGLLVNASRSILYAEKGRDFAAGARRAALALRESMKVLLAEHQLL